MTVYMSLWVSVGWEDAVFDSLAMLDVVCSSSMS